MEPKEKDNKPIIPTLKDSANKPQLKIKGLASGGMSLIERLKQFKKKDLAFIMAGLGVLFMAPLAEHFMMAPEGQNGDLFGPGISSRGDGKAFGGSSSPYETGTSSLAPGSALGANGDVITPLNVRDPSALVMGPGATTQPPAGSPIAQTPPDKKESTDWKDALANSAATAGKAATKAAHVPVPKVPLSQSGLRGLGAIAGGGSGGGFSAAPLSAAGVPNKAGGTGNMPGVRGGGNIRGVARGPGQGAGGGFDALRKAAQGAANDFNRGGGAGSSLDAAANRSMGDGSAFGGASGESNGTGDKGPGGNQGKDSKSVGESLEFLRMKAEQDHAIDLEWKLKEKAAMRWPNLEDKILEEGIMTPWKAITAAIGKSVTSLFSPGSGTLSCYDPTDTSGPGGKPSPFPVSKGDIADTCGAVSGGQDAKAGAVYCYCNTNQDSVCKMGGSNAQLVCSGKGGAGANTNTDTDRTQRNQPQVPSAAANASCSGLNNYITGKIDNATIAKIPNADTDSADVAESIQTVNNANAVLTGDPKNPKQDCVNAKRPVPSYDGGTNNVQNLLNSVRVKLVGNMPKDGKDPVAINTTQDSLMLSLQNTNAGTQQLIGSITGVKADDKPDTKAKSDFKDADDKARAVAKDDDVQPAKDALKTAYGDDNKGVAANVKTLADAMKKSDPAALRKILTEASTALTEADKGLTYAEERLGYGEKLNHGPTATDPTFAASLTKTNGITTDDYKKANTTAGQLRQAYKTELGMVNKLGEADKGLVDTVNKNATESKALGDGKGTVPGDGMSASYLATSPDLAAKKGVDTFKPPYTKASDSVMKDLGTQRQTQQKLLDGSTPGSTPVASGVAGLFNANTIKGATTTMRDTSDCILLTCKVGP
ncbi:MAG: hypothetical protein HY077_03320 [Elusimicrobia bacterium]|nr:hypothetical protein [Elusimicrobiota bacterium]